MRTGKLKSATASSETDSIRFRLRERSKKMCKACLRPASRRAHKSTLERKLQSQDSPRRDRKAFVRDAIASRPLCSNYCRGWCGLFISLLVITFAFECCKIQNFRVATCKLCGLVFTLVLILVYILQNFRCVS